MESFNWTCPFCGHHTTINNDNYKLSKTDFYDKVAKKFYRLKNEFIRCPNIECQETNINIKIEYLEKYSDNHWEEFDNYILQQSLIPKSKAKVFPEYVPQGIRQDYEEACLIVNDSPKASATLSRRCLQGMIRDFYDIKETNLAKEIEAIKDKIDPLVWNAIDSVRKIGNIGAHMEKDINFIIDVDLNEAELLIELIEQLIEDWYIKRYNQQQRLEKIKQIADEKKQLKTQNVDFYKELGI